MEQYQLIKNVKDSTILRKSFNELANLIFGINFEEWYERGFWTEKYQPFCYVDNQRVISNVSVNKLNLIINGESKRAIQIGTVMTHPDYRNRGLSRKLMEEILQTFKGQYELMYLFANDSVLHFYPKFGFQPRDEYIYSTGYRHEMSNCDQVRRLDGRKEEDLRFIYEFAKERLPVSETFSTVGTQELLMFYCMYVFSFDFYYIEDQNVIVIMQEEGNKLHIYDILSQNKCDIKDVLSKIATHSIEEIVFHYTTDYEGIKIAKTLYRGSEQLFVKSEDSIIWPDHIKHPQTSQA